MTACLRVLEVGTASTLQDGGRWGYQRFGMPVAGALDDVSRHIANALVGNDPATAAIEVAVTGLAFAVEADSIIASVAGLVKPFDLERAGIRSRVPAYRTFAAVRGDILRFSPPAGGAVFYIAVAGGFAVDPMLGSRSTYRRAAVGGFEGRALLPGDRLPLHGDQTDRPVYSYEPPVKSPEALRFLRGPNVDAFASSAFETLVTAPYTVSGASDRMGLRLNGAALERANKTELPPQGTTAGALQVPPDGLPILLLSDRQTTGGYPRIGTVISADIAAAGRLTPGMPIRFHEVTRDEALLALKGHRDWLQVLASSLRPLPPDLFSSSRLLGENLIGGVTDALDADK